MKVETFNGVPVIWVSGAKLGPEQCGSTTGRGSGGRLGPQWVQGKALAGGPGGEAPRPKTDFRQIGD